MTEEDDWQVKYRKWRASVAARILFLVELAESAALITSAETAGLLVDDIPQQILLEALQDITGLKKSARWLVSRQVSRVRQHNIGECTREIDIMLVHLNRCAEKRAPAKSGAA